MKKIVFAVAASLIAMTATPAFADDGAADTDSMMEMAAPAKMFEPIDLPTTSFDLSTIDNMKTASFMATQAAEFEPGYRVQENGGSAFEENNSGIASLLVPEEFAFRSNAQDTGVDAVIPGRFLSNSVRSDFLSDTGPAANDKSSVGVRFGF